MAGQPNIAAEVELAWADGTYLFALKLKQIEELQRLCGAGLGEIAQRLLVQRRWYAGDVVETIRLGLIGGGLPAVRARELVDTYVDGHPLADPRDPANPLATARGRSSWPPISASPRRRRSRRKSRGRGGRRDGWIDVAAFTGQALAIGISPLDIGRMSLAEFLLPAEAYARITDPGGAPTMAPPRRRLRRNAGRERGRAGSWRADNRLVQGRAGCAVGLEAGAVSCEFADHG